MLKFLEHFAAITQAMDDQGLWDDADGLFYDRLLTPDGTAVPVKVRSMVGIIPLLAAAVVDEAWSTSAGGRQAVRRLRRPPGPGRPDKLSEAGLLRGDPGDRQLLLSVVGIDRLERLFAKLFDERRVPVPLRAAGPVGLPPRPSLRPRRRGVQRHNRLRAGRVHHRHVRRQLQLARAAVVPAQLPGRQRAGALPPVLRRRAHHRVPDRLGPQGAPGQIAADLSDRLISIFLVGPDGRRPCFGWVDKLQHDPAWRDNLFFNEYFHGDNGAGLGASHQTGWTGLIADVIRRRHGAVGSVGDVLRGIAQTAWPSR